MAKNTAPTSMDQKSEPTVVEQAGQNVRQDQPPIPNSRAQVIRDDVSSERTAPVRKPLFRN